MLRLWTRAEISILTDTRAKGVTYKTIASILGRTERSVYCKARRLGLCDEHTDTPRVHWITNRECREWHQIYTLVGKEG